MYMKEKYKGFEKNTLDFHMLRNLLPCQLLNGKISMCSKMVWDFINVIL